ncbi:S-adenosyl-methyltransferase MraW [Anopheles sinensis]|uniref:S-adenosyl-methyltransferase MraW n=1 Tax=Anopheles sinensis TaxID=74873 RepID=A0A084VB91_ANOSI|nr:S-adenosyl-methyltransferase MraW [Anopheles sinensis]
MECSSGNTDEGSQPSTADNMRVCRKIAESGQRQLFKLTHAVVSVQAQLDKITDKVLPSTSTPEYRPAYAVRPSFAATKIALKTELDALNAALGDEQKFNELDRWRERISGCMMRFIKG